MLKILIRFETMHSSPCKTFSYSEYSIQIKLNSQIANINKLPWLKPGTPYHVTN
jgi:hypothetical protein